MFCNIYTTKTCLISCIANLPLQRRKYSLMTNHSQFKLKCLQSFVFLIPYNSDPICTTINSKPHYKDTDSKLTSHFYFYWHQMSKCCFHLQFYIYLTVTINVFGHCSFNQFIKINYCKKCLECQ